MSDENKPYRLKGGMCQVEIAQNFSREWLLIYKVNAPGVAPIYKETQLNQGILDNLTVSDGLRVVADALEGKPIPTDVSYYTGEPASLPVEPDADIEEPTQDE